MQAPDAARARLTTGLLALFAAGAVTVALDDPTADLAAMVRACSIAALAIVAIGAFMGWPALGLVAAALLGAAFTFGQVGREQEAVEQALDSRLVPVAIALLLIAELTAWSAEARTERPPGVRPADRAQRLVAVSAIGGAGALTVAVAVTIPAPNDLAVAAVAVAAVALAAGVIVGSVRLRLGSRGAPPELD